MAFLYWTDGRVATDSSTRFLKRASSERELDLVIKQARISASGGCPGRWRMPKKVRFETRREPALGMLEKTGPLLPHGWVTGDDKIGRSTPFRRELQGRNELLAQRSSSILSGRVSRPSGTTRTLADRLSGLRLRACRT
jgi:hypothetical protein